jgi:hypothetical protein
MAAASRHQLGVGNWLPSYSSESNQSISTPAIVYLTIYCYTSQVMMTDRALPESTAHGLFVSVHHITGVKMRAYFYSGDEGKSLKVMGRRWKSTPGDGDSDVGSMAYDAFAFGSRVRLFNWMRKFKMIMKAHLSPWNSGTLAAEALVSPFFGPNRSPPHAELPVCVSAAFPFRQGV